MNDKSPWPRSRFQSRSQAALQIQAGCLLVRPKRGGIGEHWGVVLPNGLIIENQFEVGPRVVRFADFVAPNERVDIIFPPIELRDLDAIAYRANLVLSRRDPYDLFKKNCEHTAMYVVTGEYTSGQIFVLSIVAACSVALLVIRANQRAA